jgi:NADPH:quinone reductase-like Zn-dependent oxidoreductase
MKRWIVAHKAAPKEALTLKTDWPVPPAPNGSDVLVKVSFAALNPADTYLIGGLPTWLPFRRNPSPGMDFSGVVAAAGPDVPATLAVGTEVCGAMSVGQIASGNGTLAEYIAVPSSLIVPRPKGVSMAGAAGLLGIAGQTASLTLDATQATKGTRVLLNGSSGGVGSILLQALHASGAVVTAVCSGANEEMVRRLGADEVIDYKKETAIYDHLSSKFKDAPLDVIVDTVGDGDLYTKSPAYLKPHGRFVTIVGGPTQGVAPTIKYRLRPVILGGTPRAFHLLALAPSGAQAAKVARWVDEGWVKEAPVDSIHPMEQAIEAYEKLMTHRAKGKLVVNVGGSEV